MDVLDAMSSQGREVLTIMITAYATFETAVKATKLGAYDFLAKPFTPEELRYALRKATSQLILSKQARKLAEEKREIRFNFISVLAHELKAPLNAVEGYLNILPHHRGGPEPADGRAQHRPRGRDEEAHHGPARPHAHRVRPARARRSSAWTCASWPRHRWSCSPSTPSAVASP